MLDRSRHPAPAPIQIGRTTFEWGARTYVMGILNASPDSFSGDGLVDPDEALRRAEAMVAAGADLIDIGAESTRPDFDVVDAQEEWRRLHLVLGPVRRAFDLRSLWTPRRRRWRGARSSTARMRSTT